MDHYFEKRWLYTLKGFYLATNDEIWSHKMHPWAVTRLILIFIVCIHEYVQQPHDTSQNILVIHYANFYGRFRDKFVMIKLIKFYSVDRKLKNLCQHVSSVYPTIWVTFVSVIMYHTLQRSMVGILGKCCHCFTDEKIVMLMCTLNCDQACTNWPSEHKKSLILFVFALSSVQNVVSLFHKLQKKAQ